MAVKMLMDESSNKDNHLFKHNDWQDKSDLDKQTWNFKSSESEHKVMIYFPLRSDAPDGYRGEVDENGDIPQYRRMPALFS